MDNKENKPEENKKELSAFEVMEKKEYDITKDFEKSKLSGKACMFRNGIGLIFVRDQLEKFDCINEAITTIENCKECLPKNSVIKFSGIQLSIESKEELSENTVQALENFGFQYQGATVPFDKDEVWVSTVFAQDPNYWSKDFEDFLKTYHQYLSKKYKDRNSAKRKLLDFVDDVKRNRKEFFKRFSREEKK